MSKLNLGQQVPVTYDSQQITRIINAICTQVNSLAEGSVAARYQARVSVPADVNVSYAVSDIIWDSNATVTGGAVRIGWICTAPGTGATATFAQIISNPSAGSGTVTSVSVTTNAGVAAIVTNPSTAPQLSFSLGAITPASIAAVGAITGSNLSNTNTGDQTIILTGDATGTGSATVVATLASVNPNVGSFTSPNVSFDAKGRATSVSSGAGGSGLNDQILIQDQQNSGTGGHAYTNGAWRTVTLNTTVTDTGSNVVSLGSNQFALVAGSYEFEGIVNAGYAQTGGGANKVRPRLRNITDSTTVAQGVQLTSDDTLAGLPEVDMLTEVFGSFVIAAQKTFELQVFPATQATLAAVALTTGDKEIYASIRLRRYA